MVKFKVLNAEDLWENVGHAAWAYDPGIQFTYYKFMAYISKDGEIRASNPCSEYMFLDDTAVIASMNFVFLKNGKFDMTLLCYSSELP